MKYKVIERFLSIDGEGPTAGELAAFIRFVGCNLACGWCDTAYSIDSSGVGEFMDKEQIYEYIKSSGAANVTLTGGEPMLQQGFDELLEFISRDQKLMIHIETNGSIPIDMHEDIMERMNISFIVDYKLPESGMEAFMHLPNFTRLRKMDACKFVIASLTDLEKATEIIYSYDLLDRCLVLLSPIASSIEPAVIVEHMKRHHMSKARLQLQLHKLIWPPETRCV